MHALLVLNLHSLLQTPQLSVLLHSLTQAPACLAYICTKLGNLHMGPGKQLLPVFLWGSDSLV